MTVRDLVQTGSHAFVVFTTSSSCAFYKKSDSPAVQLLFQNNSFQRVQLKMLRLAKSLEGLLKLSQTGSGPHFTVCELASNISLPSSKSYYYHYSNDVGTDVRSKISIVQSSSLPDYSFSSQTSVWSPFSKSLPKEKCIVLQQEDRGKESSFLLAECQDETEALEAMSAIDETLSPLLNEGTIYFSKKLLESLILPEPLPVDDLMTHLVELMEHQSGAYSHWFKVAQALNKIPASTSSFNAAKSFLTPADLCMATSTGSQPDDWIVRDYGTPASTKVPQFLKMMSYDAESISEEFFTPCAQTGDVFTFNESPNVSQNPLLYSISKGYAKSSLHLLLGGVNPNDTDMDGNTPLHLAAGAGNLLLVQLLVTFEADPRLTNRSGETPLNVALDAGAYDCALIIEEVVRLLNARNDLMTSDRTTKSSHSNDSSPFLLTLDGGGVRAIMEIQVLLAIEKQMKKISPLHSSSILKSFDYIAGTSGGAYVMFITVFGKKSLTDARSLVFSALNQLSEGSSPETDRATALEGMLQDMLGTETLMSDVQSPRVMATATLADRSPSKLHLLTNYGLSRDGQLGPDKRKAWEAARITSAVPIYFGSFEGKFLDGGVMCNNPTLDAIAEVIDQEKAEGTNRRPGLVLSLGSGVTEARAISNVDVQLPSWSFSSLLKLPQSLRGLKNLGEIVLNQLTSSDGQDVERCRSLCHQMDTQYYRLSPPVQESLHLNESDTSKMIGILFDAQMHVLRESETIYKIAESLVYK